MASPFETGIVESFDFQRQPQDRSVPGSGLQVGRRSAAGTPATVTYSFPPAGAHLGSRATIRPYAENEPLTASSRSMPINRRRREPPSLYGLSVANITFTEIDESANLDDVGDIRFGNSTAVTNSSSAAWAYLPYDETAVQVNYPENGDIWFDYESRPEPGAAARRVRLLYDDPRDRPRNRPRSSVHRWRRASSSCRRVQTNQRYSIMVYNLYSGATIEAYGPMLYDILAIQYIYGTNMTTARRRRCLHLPDRQGIPGVHLGRGRARHDRPVQPDPQPGHRPARRHLQLDRVKNNGY